MSISCTDPHPSSAKLCSKRRGRFVQACERRSVLFWEEKVFDSETFWQFLRQVSSCSGRRVAVISDNAKYHHALLHREWRQQLEPRFALHFLPSYSPQLNPIERICKLTRRLCLHNVFFAHLQEVTDCVEEQFEQWKNPNDTSVNFVIWHKIYAITYDECLEPRELFFLSCSTVAATHKAGKQITNLKEWKIRRVRIADGSRNGAVIEF